MKITTKEETKMEEKKIIMIVKKTVNEVLNKNFEKIDRAIQEEINSQVEDRFKKDIKKELFNLINVEGKFIILDAIKKIKPEDVLTKRLDSLLESNFKPIIKMAISETSREMDKKINRKLKNIIDLKTSTIMDIKHEINKEQPQTEKAALKNIELDFPEYYKQIRNEAE